MIVSDLVYINEPEHGPIIAAAAGGYFNPACDQTIARVKDGELLGGVLFDHYTGSAISIHTAGFVPHWVNRDLIFAVFHYAFEQLKVKKIFGQTPASNEQAIRFNTSAGFKVEHVIEDVFPDGPMLLFSMKREECRWLDRIKLRGVVADRYVHVPKGVIRG